MRENEVSISKAGMRPASSALPPAPRFGLYLYLPQSESVVLDCSFHEGGFCSIMTTFERHMGIGNGEGWMVWMVGREGGRERGQA